MSIYAYIAVFSAVLLPAILYFSQALRERKNITDIRDFFPLKRSLSSREYRSTTVAAGMSLATVIVALINLAPMLGLTLMVSVVTYSLGYLILYPCVGRIMSANPKNDSIPGFLGNTYQSSAVKYIALTFLLIGYISIFSMELLVGVTVLEPFLGSSAFSFALIYLLFIIIYALMSGYRAVIATDRWQLRFIIVSIVALIVFAVLQTREVSDANVLSILSTISTSWLPIWPFIIGITVMNLPAPISDAGTWQRLCSTKDATTARRGLRQIVPFFAIIWTVIILFACYYSYLAVDLGFDSTKEPLLSFIMKMFATSGPFIAMLLFLFVLGLFSAMISTADSLLIVAGQIFSIDILALDPEDDHPSIVMKKARTSMAVLAIASFIIFSVFQLIKFDVVQLVFSIYGAQLALFPAVFFALFFSRKFAVSNAKIAAGASILSGFAGGWGSAIYGKISGSLNWLYYAPVTALLSGMIVFIILSAPVLLASKSKN